MSRRSRARVVAFQVLFQDDLNPHGSVVWRDQMIQDELKQEDLILLARTLVAGVRHHRGEIDLLLSRVAANWTVERMAATDRNILRLAAYEMLHTETPGRVVINEAINLAKEFGTEESSQFVNGILDRLLADPAGQGPTPEAVAKPEPAAARPFESILDTVRRNVRRSRESE